MTIPVDHWNMGSLGRTIIALIAGLAVALAMASPPAASAAGCKGSNLQPAKLSKKKATRAITCLMNKERKKKGLKKLKAQKQARKAAVKHSKKMISVGCFEHQCKGEASLSDRLTATGYLPCGCSWGVGENLAQGEGSKGTPRALVKAWMKSSGHRANILDRDYEHLGVGVVFGSPGNPSSKRHLTVTTVFGFRN